MIRNDQRKAGNIMSEYNRSGYYGESAGSLNAYVTKVFGHMGIGLLITAAVAFLGYYSASTGGLFLRVLTTAPWLTFVFCIAELGIAIAFGAGLTRFSPAVCRLLFFVYSALTGITFAFLPMYYGLGTFFTAFLFAAVLFVCCAVIGHTTNIDLTRFSGLLSGALLSLVIMTVISLFIPALRNSLFIGYAGLIIFLGITAFDMQKIRSFYYTSTEGYLKENLAIYMAFQLYLDFINIFLYVLRILGSRNSRN
ncbi:MAG TPA: BAX inhibitor (BI)-1/YccA family protein [Erysipelotrichaceae bacterium]|nr:BAX inhibitor (BI)-1/YccA family protein [Erysipelotrichaceae bacterium]